MSDGIKTPVRTEFISFRTGRTNLLDADGDIICRGSQMEMMDIARRINREDEKNALTSAAPELLAAAKRALNVLKSQGESVRPGNVLGALQDAITKATSK